MNEFEYFVFIVCLFLVVLINLSKKEMIVKGLFRCYGPVIFIYCGKIFDGVRIGEWGSEL